jgi:hypothetical protein
MHWQRESASLTSARRVDAFSYMIGEVGPQERLTLCTGAKLVALDHVRAQRARYRAIHICRALRGGSVRGLPVNRTGRNL